MSTLIDLVQTFGLPMILLITLLQSLGLPLPAFAILVVTAAVMPPNAADIGLLILTGVLGTFMGDMVLYYAGKHYGTRVLARLCKISLSPDSCVSSSGDLLDRYGSPALTVAKFVPGLSTIAPVIAGVYHMRLRLFGFFSLIAAIIYLASAVLLGNVFRRQVSSILSTLSDYGKAGGLIILLAFGVYILFKWYQRRRLLRQFNVDRVTVEDLLALIQQENLPVILDARPVDQRVRNGFIPGSIAVDDANLSEIADRYGHNNEVIVYCSCPNEITAAKYADQLRKAGIRRIRPLLGGIDEWARSGGVVLFS
ncbi:rhodanese-like domain-containing protein [Mucilaginibacter sp. CSA2-8R]|uniref:rhodanese-like domain-containing protein n=1 Tax=Mucilaginibacter sp. CSA2-8R TaxID=3141542 RepID=UPI00315C59A4